MEAARIVRLLRLTSWGARQAAAAGAPRQTQHDCHALHSPAVRLMSLALLLLQLAGGNALPVSTLLGLHVG